MLTQDVPLYWLLTRKNLKPFSVPCSWYIPPSHKSALFYLTAIYSFGCQAEPQSDLLLLITHLFIPTIFSHRHFIFVKYFGYFPLWCSKKRSTVAVTVTSCSAAMRSECDALLTSCSQNIEISTQASFWPLGEEVHKWHILLENTGFNRKYYIVNKTIDPSA